MSKLELINSGSENENNGTEGSEAVDDQYLLAWLCKVATIHANPLFQECPWKRAAQEKNHQIQEMIAVKLEILSGGLVVNAN